MKAKISSKIWLVAVPILFALGYLFQFGPPTIRVGEDRILASASLDDGSKVFIVAHRTGHLVDTYEVTLYRVGRDKSIALNWLGYEDGYWWGCKLKQSQSDVLQIHAFGQLLGEYRISTGLVNWQENGETLKNYRVADLGYKPNIPPIILSDAIP